MRRLHFSLPLLLVAAAVVFLGSAALQAQTNNPISFDKLTGALKTVGPSTALAGIIRERGVDFQLTADKESDLKAAGATPEVLAAVRESYQAPAPPPAPVPPPAPAPVAAAQPPEPPPAAAPAAPAGPPVTSLREVKKLYVEAMPNELDKYLKAEIIKEMPNRLSIVLQKADADAVMSGAKGTKSALMSKEVPTANVTITDNRGSLVLWTAEESARGMPGWSKMGGGQQVIAERLVKRLKETMK